MFNASLADASTNNVVVLEDSVGTVEVTGSLFVTLINITINLQRIQGGTQFETVIPVTLVYRAIPHNLENDWRNDDDGRVNCVYRFVEK